MHGRDAEGLLEWLGGGVLYDVPGFRSEASLMT